MARKRNDLQQNLFGPKTQPEAPKSKTPDPPKKSNFDYAARKHGGNPESTAAYERTKHNLDKFMQEIEDWIITKGRYGATTDEVAIHFGKTPNEVSPKMTELRAQLRLIPIAAKRKTHTGTPAKVSIARQFATEAEIAHAVELQKTLKKK